MTGPGINDQAPQTPGVHQDAAGAVSPVTVKAAKPQTIREFEQAVRALGFTKSEARAIASNGFKAIGGADEPEDLSELAQLVSKITSNLKDSTS